MDMRTFDLNDKYTLTTGSIYLSGIQALTRLSLMQKQRDVADGLHTGGFISGYRGSPLGTLDKALWSIEALLTQNDIQFQAGINEDLAATAVWGSQQLNLFPGADYDGVFGLWYGKGPGVDRSGDVFKHANAAGTSKHGGVLLCMGDDHTAKSSTLPNQSEFALIDAGIPILNPSSIQEILDYGLYGWAMSRYCGCWVGLKTLAETMDASASVNADSQRVQIIKPHDFELPADGVHIRSNDTPLNQEARLYEHKLYAAIAFARANGLNRMVIDSQDAKLGIITTGKSYLDVRQALSDLGIDSRLAHDIGIRLYKVGMPWPLDKQGVQTFAEGLDEILVVEEKRALIENQLKEQLYNLTAESRPGVIGKCDEHGNWLLPPTSELTPARIARVIAKRIGRYVTSEPIRARLEFLEQKEKSLQKQVLSLQRKPHFCSGCPHNTSTKVPEGSKAASGIGCHVMASWMDRDTAGYAQMGGEGVPWVAASKYNGNKHIFQNLGEGTWYHSGSLAIRQAVAAETNITYKILYNDAVAMTGGQPVDGPVSVRGIAQTCRAEGVDKIVLVSDDISKFSHGEFPAGTMFRAREDLDAVQRDLREVKGVSVLIYEQTCATEKRRRRKRGTLEDPKRFAVINPLVCEGCGDCSVESNCLSVEPLETKYGTKRKINLSNCNKDFSCLNGFCPSFVTVEGAERRKKKGADFDLAAMVADLAMPTLPSLTTTFDLLVTGVGGTGVVTVGALITMAAHIEGRGASVLDFTGFAQKFGTVLSYIRLGETPADIHQVRIDQGSADAVIGCDIVVSSAPRASVHYRKGSRVVLNRAKMPTGDLVLHRDADLRVDTREQVIRAAVGPDNVSGFDANEAAETLLGDSVFANVLMLGYAWQKGLVPVSEAALKQAILLNAVAVERNVRAFDLGRVLAGSPEVLSLNDRPAEVDTFESIMADRAAFLTDYQNASYAARYCQTLVPVRDALGDALAIVAARSLFKLMAYKDEYEVARLHTQTGFEETLKESFSGDFKIQYHMAPPILPLGKDGRGRPVKRALGAWMTPVMRGLARGKRLRGTVFDPFGYAAERRTERGLIMWFEGVLQVVAARGAPDTDESIARILAAPMDIRGYGPVKEAAIADVKARVDVLRARL